MTLLNNIMLRWNPQAASSGAIYAPPPAQAASAPMNPTTQLDPNPATTTQYDFSGVDPNAMKLLRAHFGSLPQPQQDQAIAEALAGAGKPVPTISSSTSVSTSSSSSENVGGSNLTPPSNAGLTGLSFAQVENYWIQAGGNAQAASMAAAVADAESGLNAAATRTNPDGTVGIGLWLIPQNGTPPGSTDPLANARAAVQLSQNGTDWTQWCSTWSDNNCGENNGTYLGSGANALMSLAGQKPGAAYNVFGATPSGNGVSASSTTSGITRGAASAPTTSSKSKIIILGVIILGIILYFYMRRRKPAEQTENE